MSDEVLFTQEGQLGIITLNRQEALNALTLPMILDIQQQLQLWKNEASIHAVVIRALAGNAFCAGGDVRWLYQTGKSHDPQQLQFFWHEYRLNHFIHHLGKPYIALMDGLTMGGGVGVSLHGSHPVASERFVFAMPETGIGYFPDIGASHLLTRCPGYSGIYSGLTGNRFGPQDALKAGLIKQVISSEHMPDVVNRLINEDLSANAYARVDACLQTYSMPSLTDEITLNNPLIDVCFSHPTVELILQSLHDSDTVWGKHQVTILEKKSPLSLKVTLEQLNKTRKMSLANCLKIDYNLVRHFIKDNDFYEGVRALLIDKDKKPHWNPQRLDLVSERLLINYFEQSGSELEL